MRNAMNVQVWSFKHPNFLALSATHGTAQMAAEFTNHLIPGAVLTPGIVGTLPELMLAGYQYAK
jgi:hypothetical protein